MRNNNWHFIGGKKRMVKQKDSTNQMVVVGVLVLLAVFGTLFATGAFNTTGSSGDIGSGESLACVGIASVSNTITARDDLARSTTASGEYMYITTNNVGAKAFGSITGLTPGLAHDALLSHNGTSYFAQVYDFETSCNDETRTVYLASPSAPTVSFVNENGVTLNGASAAEAVDADQTYTGEMTIRAPGNKYSSLHGALIVAEWDKTYVRNVEVNGVSLASLPTYLSHTTLLNTTTATGDAFRTFLYPGEVKDGERVTLTFTYETTSETPGANNANIAFHWIPRNLYIDDETLEIAGPSVEDRDNTFIGLANTTAIFYTS